jgi:tetratricopeptide (TPR) repeat protein
MHTVSQRALELNDKGERLRSEGNLEGALKAFSGAVLAWPGYTAAWLNRADVLEKMGREDEAEADRQAVRSLTAAKQSQLYSVPEARVEVAREWIGAAPPEIRYEGDDEDVVGPGRYILNFSLAGSYVFARFLLGFPGGWFDVVGPEWYISVFCLTFFPVGLVAMWYTYLLRNHGWLATWIGLALVAMGLVLPLVGL